MTLEKSSMGALLTPIQRFLRNPSLVGLVLFFISLTLILHFLGQWLLPVIIAIVVAYLLEGLISKLEHFGIRRMMAVFLVFLAFFTIAYLLLGLIPTIIHQAKTLAAALPEYVRIAQEKLMALHQHYPQFFKEEDISALVGGINIEISSFSKTFFSRQLFSSLITVVTVIVYTILIPMLVFFMLKDKEQILNWLGRFLPKNRRILQEIWLEVNLQIGNYIRGKFIEIIIVWMACFSAFHIFGLDYTLLISLSVGLSVLIPYIGASVVTIPVLVVTYAQFGISANFWWVISIYAIIQTIDGNIIVPLLFSEAVNIHPIAIIASVLVFGGMWGFWGIFFAIPLATLVKAIMGAWERAAIRGEEQAC